MKKIRFIIGTTLMLSGIPNAFAQDVFVYPAKGQTAEQQDKDKYECFNWAKTNTGYDPSKPAPVAAPAEQQRGGAARGAAKGAALGAIVGDSSDAAGKGAALGAVAGAARQGATNKQAAAENTVQSSESAAQSAEYDRAYGACLEGRGYTVK